MNKAVFQTKLFRLMKQNQDDAKKRKTKTGLIDSSRLSRYQLTNRVFKHRNQEKEGKNYFVSILMDCSGSMRDGCAKDKICCETVIALCDSLKVIPGMHFEVVGFNSFEVKYKDYAERYNAKTIEKMYYSQYGVGCYLGATEDKDLVFREKKEDLKDCTYINYYCGAAGENHDGVAVYNSLQRMKERKGRKILLVFSDGAPTMGYAAKELIQGRFVETISGSKELCAAQNTGPARGLQWAVESKEKDVDILGVGIIDSSVKRYYPHYIIVNNVKCLYIETVKALSGLFKKD